VTTDDRHPFITLTAPRVTELEIASRGSLCINLWLVNKRLYSH